MKCIDCIGGLQGLATIKRRKCGDCTQEGCKNSLQSLQPSTHVMKQCKQHCMQLCGSQNIYVLCNFSHLFRLPQPSAEMPFMYYRGILTYFTFFYYSKRNNRDIIPTNLENKEVIKPSPVNQRVMCVVELKFVSLTGTNYYGSELRYIALWTALSCSTHTRTHTHTHTCTYVQYTHGFQQIVNRVYQYFSCQQGCEFT